MSPTTCVTLKEICHKKLIVISSPSQVCNTVNEQQCSTVNEQECQTVYDTRTEQQCQTVYEQECQTTTQQVRSYKALQ